MWEPLYIGRMSLETVKHIDYDYELGRRVFAQIRFRQPKKTTSGSSDIPLIVSDFLSALKELKLPEDRIKFEAEAREEDYIVTIRSIGMETLQQAVGIAKIVEITRTAVRHAGALIF